MAKRGLYIMLPMRVRESYPGVDDEIITLPEITLPPSVRDGGSVVTPGDAGIPSPDGSFDFAVQEIGLRLPFNHANDPSPMSAVKTSVTFHWEGEDFLPIMSEEQTVQFLDNVAAQHIAKDWGHGFRGNGIMYHEAIAQNGTSLIMRPYGDIVWHSNDGTGNATSRAILVVCSRNSPPTDAQLRAIRKRTVDFGVPVWAHSDWSATQCPGDTIRALVNDLRAHGYS